MCTEEFLNPPALDPAIEFLENELRIALASTPRDVNVVLSVYRGLRTLYAMRAADEIRAQWSYTPERDPEPPAADADRKTF